MKRFARVLSLFLVAAAPVLALGATSSEAQAADEPAPDPRAVAKIKAFLEISAGTPNLNEAGKKVVAAGLVQKSKLDKNDPSQLNPDSLRFSYKKAHDNAKFYQPKITRVLETTVSGVGFGPTAEKGKLVKYFVAKKDGVNGLPAPIHVFFPEGGADPVLYDWGSL